MLIGIVPLSDSRSKGHSSHTRAIGLWKTRLTRTSWLAVLGWSKIVGPRFPLLAKAARSGAPRRALLSCDQTDTLQPRHIKERISRACDLQLIVVGFHFS